MSGFSKEWLALREPADAMARDLSLLSQLILPDTESLKIIDLGAGGGSNLRYLAPLLGASQHWRLVDGDQRLLDSVVIPQISQDLRVEKHLLDLAQDLDALDLVGVHLVTASAFFDLVSKDWTARFATKCAEAKVAFGLFALNVDGRISWSPQDPDDEEIRSHFNAHMQHDKGFGPALGPRAPEVLETLFHSAGYRVFSGDSSWCLGTKDTRLQSDLLQGYMQAVSEHDPSKMEMFEAWHKRRRAHIALGGSELSVGHRDVLVRLE